VVIGIAMVPAILLLCVAFTMFERGRVGLGAAAAAGFLGILMPVGLVARRLQREIEVDETGMRELRRGEQVTAIRWDEPHTLTHRTVTYRKTFVPVGGTIFVTLTAGDRTIKFSTTAKVGIVGLAGRMPRANDLRDGAEAVARAVELSAAAQRSV
jgi:hypothetical protein